MNKTQKLTIRFTESQAQTLKQAAAAQGVDVSKYVRSIVETPKNKDAA